MTNEKLPRGSSAMLLLSQRFEAFEQEVDNKFAEIGGRFDKMEATIREWMRDKQPHYYRYWSIVVSIALVFWWIINSQITNAVHNADKANSDTRELVNSNISSISRLADSVHDVSRSFTADHSERLANEREIETQFDADSQLRNIQWANMMRKINMLQNALHDLGAKLPASTDEPYFFPNISSRQKGNP